MHDTTRFQQCLGKGNNYPNYLAFFQQEIDAKGVGEVLREYLFAGDERAESMLCRLFGGKYYYILVLPCPATCHMSQALILMLSRLDPSTHPPRIRT